jgi:hypothetical protein
MARQVNIAERLFQPGAPMVRTVDSFPADVRSIIITFTRVGWPGTPADRVAKVSASWSDGTGMQWEFPGGEVLDKAGQPEPVSRVRIDVPTEGDGAGGWRRRAVTSGSISFEVRQALRTAISIEAVA